MLELSERGDNSTVDMLVSDVYGNSNALNAFGLKSSTIASSFGKVFRRDARGPGGAEGRKKKFSPQDICKSLLYAVSNNIGQIAHMTAEKYELDQIYFGGCFIRGHQATISTLSYAIRFWSKGTKRAFFLRHEGYLGAIGAWIKHLDDPVGGLPAPLKTGSAQVNGQAKPEELSRSLADVDTQTGSSHGAPTHLHRLDTPIVQGPQPSESEAVGTAAPLVNEDSKPTSHRPQRQAQDEGMDMLSMLSSLQDDHRALVAPLVAAQTKLADDRPPRSLANGTGSHAVMSQRSEEDAEEQEDDADEGAIDNAEDLQDLLAQLDAANGAADGLESKLDGLLERLDGLLGRAGVEE
jgi:type II pantothenate kinase